MDEDFADHLFLMFIPIKIFKGSLVKHIDHPLLEGLVFVRKDFS